MAIISDAYGHFFPCSSRMDFNFTDVGFFLANNWIWLKKSSVVNQNDDELISEAHCFDSFIFSLELIHAVSSCFLQLATYSLNKRSDHLQNALIQGAQTQWLLVSSLDKHYIFLNVGDCFCSQIWIALFQEIKTSGSFFFSSLVELT